MASPDDDASTDSAKNQSSASGQEADPPEEESTPAGEQVTQKKRGKKRRREEKEGKKKKAALTPSPLGRPSRERKSVVRYTATASRSIPASKAVKIQQGPGELLKDIPNVAFKLSKRKSDESIRVLHKILFGRKANVHFLKRNILQFSGFVWSQNEEKERSKVKEKLNKCNKERLLDFCDLLDVYTLKITTKKEEISAKLLEFLESPHVTREVILSEKATKGKKRRRGAKGTEERVERPLEEASSDKENTRPRKDQKHESKKARKKPAKDYKEDQVKGGGSIDINDESEDKKETTEHSNSEAEDEDNENEVPESTKELSDGKEIVEREEPKSKGKSPAVRKISRTKSKKGSSSPATKKADAEDEAKVSSEIKTSKGNKGSSKTEKKKSTSKKDSKDNSIRKAPQKKGEADSGSGVPHRSKKVKEKGKSNAETASKDKQEDKKQIEKTASKDVKEDKKKIAKSALKGVKENKKQIAKIASKDVKENKKQIAKTKPKNVAKKKGKREDVGEPSTEQLHAVVSEILKEVDFNVATLADIIRQLGAHFNTDLMHRKTEIKGILEVVINNMTDDEDDEDDDGAEE